MKKNFILSVSFLIAAFTLFSCQDEENQTTISEDEALSKSAPLTGLLQRIAMVDVSSDNIIDSTSCFKVQLPVDVLVNNQPVHVASEADFAAVQQIIDVTDPIEVSVNLVFPVTVIYPDYTTEVVQDQAEFDALVQVCSTTVPQPINCLSINYPVTIYGYNSVFQLGATYIIQSDQQLFSMLLNLNPVDFYAIQFPLEVTTTSGEVLSIANNTELQAMILQANCVPVTPVECPNPKILTDSLVVYIPFANELKNLTHRGTPLITGNYHYVTDRNGNPNGAFSFDDGTNNGQNSVDIQLTTTTNGDNDIMKYSNFTFSVWVKRQDNSGANPNEMIIGNLAFSLFMGTTQDPSIKAPMIVLANNIDWTVNDPSWINEGLGSDTQNWHHLVVSYDGALNLMKLYRNGVFTVAISPSGMPNSIPRLTFGNRYKGFMDDIRVYNKVLTDAQVQQLYQLDGDVYTCLN